MSAFDNKSFCNFSLCSIKIDMGKNGVRALQTGIARFGLPIFITLAQKHNAVAPGFDHSVKRACRFPGNNDPGNMRAG